MAWTRTLAQLRSSIETTADMVSGGSAQLWTTAEKNYIVNESIAKVYDLINDDNKAPYKTSTVSFTTTAGTPFYAFASSPISKSDIYRILSVNAKIGGFYVPLGAHSWSEAAYLQNNSMPATEIQMFYVPALTPLSSDSDTFDFYNGWDEYVRYDGAIKLLEREDPDISQGLLIRKAEAEKRIKDNAGMRDMYSQRQLPSSRTRRPRGSWWAGYQIPSYMVRTNDSGADGIEFLYGGPWI